MKKVVLNEKVFKKTFKNKKLGKEYSARVISDYLGADYKDVLNNLKESGEELAFSALTVNSMADAIYYDDATYFNIELNFYNTPSKSKQIESYVYQLYLGELHTHKNYNDIKKIVQISIDSYDYFSKNEFMYIVKLMEEKYHLPYNDKIEMVHLNLDYLRKVDYNEIRKGENKLMRDVYFLACNDENILNEVYLKDNLMKEIVEETKKIAGIEKMDLYLTDEEMIKQDQEFIRKQSFAEGVEKGAYDKQVEIAKKMLKMNKPLDEIVELTGLSKRQIDELR